MLKLDKKTVAEFEDSWVKKLKVFFYEAGCSGTKINMETDFEVEESIDRLESDYGFELYVPKTDREHLEHASITRVDKLCLWKTSPKSWFRKTETSQTKF